MYDLDRFGHVAFFYNVRFAEAAEELTFFAVPKREAGIQTMPVPPIWAASFRDFFLRAQPSTLGGRRIAVEQLITSPPVQSGSHSSP